MSACQILGFFPKLPLELRLKIWAITVRNGCRIAHMGKVTTPCCESCICAVELLTEYTTLINACHESRNESLRLKPGFKKDNRFYHYSFRSTDNVFEPAKFVGPTPDTAFFDLQQDNIWLELFAGNGSDGLNNYDLYREGFLNWLRSNGIKSLPLNGVQVYFDTDYSYSMRHFDARMFSTLKQLRIVRFVTAYPHLHPNIPFPLYQGSRCNRGRATLRRYLVDVESHEEKEQRLQSERDDKVVCEEQR